MRWIWIDKITAFHSGQRATALKNVSLAEEHLHDHFPGFAVMPEALMIEAMAQISGVLVGEAKGFQEKVILAKIRKAVFYDFACPGDTLQLDTQIESIKYEAASTAGRITRNGQKIADIHLMFSHIDQNLAGIEFPSENFVFDSNLFKSLLRNCLAEAKTDTPDSAGSVDTSE